MRASATRPVVPLTSTNNSNKWIPVTWLPHTTLSPTSHVCFSVRSAHASLDDFLQQVSMGADSRSQEEWYVRVGVYGVGGGLELLPVPLRTLATPLVPRSRLRRGEVDDLSSEKNEINKNLADSKNRDNFRPTVSKATHDAVWDCLISMPVRWRDLPRDAFLKLEIRRSSSQQLLYQGTLPFFDRYGKMATGLQKVELYKDPSPKSMSNPGLMPMKGPHLEQHPEEEEKADPAWEASCILNQLQKQNDKQQTPNTGFGQVASVPWLDSLLQDRAMEILEETPASALLLPQPDDPSILTRASLILELPTYEIAILHEETFYPTPQSGASGTVTPLDLVLSQKRQQQKHQQRSPEDTPTTTAVPATSANFDPLELVPILDYENEADNPVEDKYRALAHDLIRGLVDPALKPDREQRTRLEAIIDSPSYHPTQEEKDLLWRFRFSLVDNRKALTKFLLAVDWTVESEVVQAAELLEQWRKRSPMDVTDALKLLGRHVAFFGTNVLVRDYAIDTLAAAPDSELRLYLLQLVQAIKYEGSAAATTVSEATTPTSSGATPSPPSPTADHHEVPALASFLINRAACNMQLANYLYWYLKVEVQHPTYGSKYRDVLSAMRIRLSQTDEFGKPSSLLGSSGSKEAAAGGLGGSSGNSSGSGGSSTPFKSIVDSVSKKIGSRIHGENTPSDSDKKKKSKKRGSQHRSMWDVLTEQDEFITGVLDIQQRCRDVRGKKDAKETELRSLLAKEGYDRDTKRDAVPLPSKPEYLVNGVHPESAVMFKSALYPALVEFHVEDTLRGDADGGKTTEKVPSSNPMLSLLGSEERPKYKVIVKTGDDLRQDQLVIMMIQLMDRLLRRAALDLCLTPYSIIATSPTSGLVEFVEGSLPISQAMAQHNGSILHFFQSVAPQKGAKYDVRPDVMSNYIRSCAGYCVITYLLGVGDRHLDNILLRKSGHFFHIDFGFIFGRDPKPLPPPFRLTREMVDGMGGIESVEYRQFCSLACQAYNALRKSAGLILNLLHLMTDAEIEDLSNNPAGDAEAVIASFEERFHLALSDEEAERFFTGLITDALSALAPRVMDVFHSFAVARR